MTYPCNNPSMSQIHFVSKRGTRAWFQYKHHLPRYGDYNYENKMVMRPYHLYNRKTYTGKPPCDIADVGEYIETYMIHLLMDWTSSRLMLDILKMESWTHMGHTANIIIKDIIRIFVSISKSPYDDTLTKINLSTSHPKFITNRANTQQITLTFCTGHHITTMVMTTICGNHFIKI